jgi:hypothetical protein
MDLAYFNDGRFYDGQIIGNLSGHPLVIRKIGELIFLTAYSPVNGTEALSREFVQDDLANLTPTITLGFGFGSNEVAKLATEAEMNAVNIQGKWNLVGAAADTVSTVITDAAPNAYFGQISIANLGVASSLNMLAGAIMQRKKARNTIGIGERFLNLLGV